MKEKVKEFLCLSQDEKTHLWETADFVFDTNVLLDLYRYTKNTRETLFDAISLLKERLFLPYHIAKEFMSNRCEVLLEAANKYSVLENDCEKFINTAKLLLRLENDNEVIRKLQDFLLQWIKEREKEDLEVKDPQNDIILEKLLEIFNKKTGEKYSEEEYRKMCEQGEERYCKKIPPGYQDKKKQENQYGDYIIWREILEHSKKEKKDIVLVTRDVKEDWWQIVNGKTIGPRVELKKEFNEYTEKVFYMYNIKTFLKNYSGGKAEGQKAISEVEKIADENRLFTIKMSNYNLNDLQNRINDRNLFSVIYNFDNILNDIIQLEKSIELKHQKIQRQRKYIQDLIEKYPVDSRPNDIQTLINKTEKNIITHQKEIEGLQEKVNKLKRLLNIEGNS